MALADEWACMPAASGCQALFGLWPFARTANLQEAAIANRSLDCDSSSEAACRATPVCGILERFGSVYTSFVSRGRMATQFIVHDKADTVGVVVVEDVRPGQDLTGWIMETDETISLKALDAV